MLSLAILMLAAALCLGAFGFATRRERAASIELEQRLERFGSLEHQSFDSKPNTRSPGAVARAVDRAVENKGFTQDLSALLARANLAMTVGEVVTIRVGSLVGGFLVGFVAGRGLTQPLVGILVGIIVAFLGWMLPHWYISFRAKKRTKQFVAQLGDTVSLMANSLRAGYSLLQTMEMVARESPAPMSEEFQRVVREVGLGISPQQAMDHLLRRITSDDLDLLVTAINIQHEVGGNLAQILEVIGETIRERVRIKGEISVLTAQQSISGYVISALPVGLCAFLFVTNPGYISQMFVFPWLCMPIVGAIMIVAGFFVMRKITQIEV